MKSSRLVCLFAIAAITWTALWPLVSSLEASMASEAMPLCHQAGMGVAMDEAPTRPAMPGERGKTHCPLCIMAFYGSASPSLVIAPPQYSTHFVILAAYEAPRPAQHAPLLPQSRAPPFLIAS